MMDPEIGTENPGFIGDNGICKNDGEAFAHLSQNTMTQKESGSPKKLNDAELPETEPESRKTWNSSWEFLMSCIAMSIGLGNIWRFPSVAWANGGGAFLIPYIIVLFLVGKPFYYIEMIIGQFTSRSSVKIWSAVPALRGVGWAQLFSMMAVATFYCALMSITLVFLIDSFRSPLPWQECAEEWRRVCADSKMHLETYPYLNYSNIIVANEHDIPIYTEEMRAKANGSLAFYIPANGFQTPAELYFSRDVLKDKADISDGIGLPDVRLSIYLALAWFCIFAVLVKGVKSSGKASYFLAIFPYVVLLTLLVRAVTLDGAWDGIWIFLKPNWSSLLNAEVWVAAVTQCFFSLSVCFGGVIMYSSYNDFRHNIYRDVIVVTTLDTFTSLIAGMTTFGIVGSLARERNISINEMHYLVQNGSGLAFITYPEAIAHFSISPQVFSILFFVMLFVLGIGSAIAIAGAIINIICDQFPKVTYWHVVLTTCMAGFLLGLVYCTPGGPFMLTLVDFYGASLSVFCLSIFEIMGIAWIYGLENLLNDIEFMLQKRPGLYWRLCWGLFTPVILAGILIYKVATLQPLRHMNTIEFPATAHAVGWTLLLVGLLQVPLWMVYTFMTNRHLPVYEMIAAAFQPSVLWGPSAPSHRSAWKEFKEAARMEKEKRTSSKLKQFIYVILCWEHKLT